MESRLRGNRLDFPTWAALIDLLETRFASFAGPEDPEELQRTVLSLRSAFRGLLLEFPLCFGYWKRWADFEAKVGAASTPGGSGWSWGVSVFEQGLSTTSLPNLVTGTAQTVLFGVPHSVDLWIFYVSFLISHQAPVEQIRAVFLRASHIVGSDFHATPLWDAFIQFEYAQGCYGEVFRLLRRILRNPVRDLDKYWVMAQQYIQTRPLLEIVEDAIDLSLHDEAAVRTGIQHELSTVFSASSAMLQRRLGFETAIRRPYFHPKPLDDAQISNWRRYLDFEERDGDSTRIIKLYERCLIPCCNSVEFWKRYLCYLAALFDPAGRRTEEDASTMSLLMHALARAAGHFLRSRVDFVLFACLVLESVSSPSLQTTAARSCGQLYASVLSSHPLHPDVVLKYAQHVRRCGGPVSKSSTSSRRSNAADAIAFLQDKFQISKGQLHILIGLELAKFLEIAAAAEEGGGRGGGGESTHINAARRTFRSLISSARGLRMFWSAYVDFEIRQELRPRVAGRDATPSPVEAVFERALSEECADSLSRDDKLVLGQQYMQYLSSRSTRWDGCCCLKILELEVALQKLSNGSSRVVLPSSVRRRWADLAAAAAATGGKPGAQMHVTGGSSSSSHAMEVEAFDSEQHAGLGFDTGAVAAGPERSGEPEAGSAAAEGSEIAPETAKEPFVEDGSPSAAAVGEAMTEQEKAWAEYYAAHPEAYQQYVEEYYRRMATASADSTSSSSSSSKS